MARKRQVTQWDISLIRLPWNFKQKSAALEMSQKQNGITDTFR